MWKVLPHRPLAQLADRVWRVEGDLANMPLKRVMTIARRDDGKLVVHNGICVDDATLAAITALGEIALIVVPSAYHRIDAPAYHARFPQAHVTCPPAARAKVERVVPVTATYDQLPRDPHVELVTLDGVRDREGAMIVRGDDTTLVLNDIVFNMPHVPGAKGFVLRALGSSGGPRVSRIARLSLVADRRALRAQLERLADLPNLRRIVVSHHEVIDREPARVLREDAAGV
jgi:hypothetical protein